MQCKFLRILSEALEWVGWFPFYSEAEDNQNEFSRLHLQDLKTKLANCSQCLAIVKFTPPKIFDKCMNTFYSLFWIFLTQKKKKQRGRDELSLSSSLPVHLSAIYRHSKKAVICKPEREPSLQLHCAGTLISDFQSPELREMISVIEATQSMLFCYRSQSWLRQYFHIKNSCLNVHSSIIHNSPQMETIQMSIS